MSTLDSRTWRAEPRAGSRWTRRSLIGLAFWVGLVAGLVELVLILAKIHLTQNGLFRRTFHLLWMAPLADTLIVGLAGLGLAVLAWPLPRIGRRLGLFGVATLAVLVPLLAIPGLRAFACLFLAIGLASWIEPAIGKRPEGFRRLMRRSTPVLLLVLGGLVALASGMDWKARHGPSPTGPPPSDAPNVLLIVLDTVRADAMSWQGSRATATPRLEELTRRGVRFDRAIATAPWTLPSHASFFTGRWTWELGVGADLPLDGRFPTLAEYLTQRGYDTAGFVANPTFCTSEYGLSRGFGHYEDYVLTPVELLRSSASGWLIARRLGAILDRAHAALGRSPGHPLEGEIYQKNASEIHQAALRWIEKQRSRGRPFFVFLNDFDAHNPYLLPEEARPRFSQVPPTLERRRLLRDWIHETPSARTPQEIAIAREAYEECVAYLDEQIGDLHDQLGRLGLLEKTILIITSDHGEHFGEHDRDGLPLIGHRLSVYQEEIHVPLLIVAPGRVPSGAVVGEAVSLRDLPATIVDLAGLHEGSPFPGQPLARYFGGARPDPATPALAEFNPRLGLPAPLRDHPGVPDRMRAIIEDQTSYHRHEDGREEFYDLATDPGEQRDLSDRAEHRERLERSRAWLDRLAPSDPSH